MENFLNLSEVAQKTASGVYGMQLITNTKTQDSVWQLNRYAIKQEDAREETYAKLGKQTGCLSNLMEELAWSREAIVLENKLNKDNSKRKHFVRTDLCSKKWSVYSFTAAHLAWVATII